MSQMANATMEKRIKIICTSGNTNVNANKIKKYLKQSSIQFNFRSTYEGKVFVISANNITKKSLKSFVRKIKFMCTGRVSVEFYKRLPCELTDYDRYD